MPLFFESHPIQTLLYGNRSVRQVYLGSRLIWPEALQHGIRSFGLCKTHAAFVLNDGTFWTIGSNKHGQLCRIDPGGSWTTPNLAQVPGIHDAVMVAVSCTENGEGTTVLLRDRGRVFSAGFSNSESLYVSTSERIAWTSLGRHGISGSPIFSNFSEVIGLSQICNLWHGRQRLLVQRSNGFVYGYGLDWDVNRAMFQWMQVKDSGGQPLHCADISLHALSPVILRSDGSVDFTGPIAPWFRPVSWPTQDTNILEPVPRTSFLTGIRKITTGRSHLVVLTQNGLLHTVGSDRFGQLCSEKFQYRNPEQGCLLAGEPIVDIACGDHHTVVLLHNGTVKTAGQNHRGQLGRAVVTGNGHDWLYYTGPDRVTEEGWFGNFDVIPGIEDATAVYAGGDMTMILRESGITVCGDNEFGQLGIMTEQHITNADDRMVWCENWHGSRPSFETNLRNAKFHESWNFQG